jgi:molybdate transport system substrate-binding protein
MKCLAPFKVLAPICIALAAQTGTMRADVTVFAAASLRGALDEIAALSDTTVTLSYAGSGTIARQVSQGAPADVVILAHPRWMDWLFTSGAILPNSRSDIAYNSLVLIGPKGAAPLAASSEIHKRLGQGRLAIGQRDAVPAGIYTQDWLEKTGQWDTLKPQLAEVENVRFALALVARGETPLGVVYRSDAQAEPRVDILYNVPENMHEKITYPAAAITTKGDEFMALISSPAALDILDSFGFISPKASQ